ncbi:hypothetical protein AB0P17_36635 [Streptomyces sp. NPDC088124]|uniref:hypothetical protein n=1 Tax=Streptomyces sp. NPDC088124 TaxID=3154654 RepID=UPI0034456984
MRDAYSNIRPRLGLPVAARTATTNGTSVDRNDNGLMYQDALITVVTGTITDGTHTVDIKESDDNSTWTSVAASDLQGTKPVLTSSAGGSSTLDIGYKGTRRYLRVDVTVATATTGGVYGALVILANGRVMPVVRP